MLIDLSSSSRFTGRPKTARRGHLFLSRATSSTPPDPAIIGRRAAGRSASRRTGTGWPSALAEASIVQSHDVTARATEETVKAFLEYELARCKPRTALMHAEDLFSIFRSMAPEKDWAWLLRIVERMRINVGEAELKPRLPISAHDLYAWSLKRIENIDRDEKSTPELRRAARFRDALMVGVLIATTFELRTFIAIDIEKHLSMPPGKVVLSFGREDMKDRKPHEFELPAQLVEPMRRYLMEFRKLLLRGNSSTGLWITQYGKPFTYHGFGGQLPLLTLKEFGVALRPHAFRSIAATSIAAEDPEHVNIIADVLRHSTLRMSEKHYNRANGVRAISDLQKMVQERRREAEMRERTMRRSAVRCRN